MKNLYKILEVEPNASTLEIKKSYHRLALRFHPDRNSSEFFQEKFKDITSAYKVLSNPEKRKKYD